MQTDRLEEAVTIGRLNAERNGVRTIEHRLADWTAWTDTERYDLILGADVVYAPRLQPSLRAIFDTNLAPGGRLLLGDPFRSASIRMLEAMELDGWKVSITKWRLGGAWGRGDRGVRSVARLKSTPYWYDRRSEYSVPGGRSRNARQPLGAHNLPGRDPEAPPGAS